jgi:phage protein D
MVQSPQPIYRGQDFYVPAFEVKVGGNDLPAETRKDVIQVRFTDTIDQFDTFDITFNNWDDQNLDFKYTGSRTHPERDELLDPGQEIELWMGYFKPPTNNQTGPQSSANALKLMLTGIITQMTPTFPANGQPTVKIVGRSALIKMITEQETHTYRAGLRDSDIAQEVDRRGNLTLGDTQIELRINSEARNQEAVHEDAVVQHNEFDILFLLRLARRNGYDLVLRKEEQNGETTQHLYFGPPERQMTYLLEWGKSLIQFQPTLTTARQVNQVTVRGWDPRRGRSIEATVSRRDLPNRSLRDLDRLYRIEQGFRERHEIIVDRPFRNRREARQFALDRLQRLSQDMVTARGSTVGVTDLRAGRKIEVQGLGRTFDGEYFLKSTTHTIGASGYTTEFDARLEEAN